MAYLAVMLPAVPQTARPSRSIRSSLRQRNGSIGMHVQSGHASVLTTACGTRARRRHARGGLRRGRSSQQLISAAGPRRQYYRLPQTWRRSLQRDDDGGDVVLHGPVAAPSLACEVREALGGLLCSRAARDDINGLPEGEGRNQLSSAAH